MSVLIEHKETFTNGKLSNNEYTIMTSVHNMMFLDADEFIDLKNKINDICIQKDCR